MGVALVLESDTLRSAADTLRSAAADVSFAFSRCEAAPDLFPGWEATLRCGTLGRIVALRLLAATACAAAPSTDFAINVGRSIDVGLGIRRAGPLFTTASSFAGGFFSSLIGVGSTGASVEAGFGLRESLGKKDIPRRHRL